MRVWYMGCALAFQARELGSSPSTRFSNCLMPPESQSAV